MRMYVLYYLFLSCISNVHSFSMACLHATPHFTIPCVYPPCRWYIYTSGGWHLSVPPRDVNCSGLNGGGSEKLYTTTILILWQ